MNNFTSHPAFRTERIIRLLRHVILTIAVSAMTACSDAVDQASFDKISVGMPKEQVIAILGRPTEASSINVAGISGESASWVKGGDSINIQFANEKVLAKRAQFQRR